MATLCLQVLRCRPHAVFTAEDYGDGFAKVLTKRFAQPVEHIRLQRPRGDKSPSGTLIRSDVHHYRYMLAHDVYRSFVRRICLLGGESTGKSTLSKALADVLDTAYVTEFGRDYWEEKNGVLTADDLLHIAREQVRREQQAEANRYLICDTSPLTTLFYALDQYGHAPQELHQLAEREYSLWWCFAARNFPWQDGTRQGEVFRARQQVWYEQELSRRNIPYLSVSGPLQERVEQILRQLPD